MKKEAFTLIELLVVIAVISILMAILMPALRKARDQGRRIICTSNVRTLITAWYIYQGDNDGKLVNGNVPASASFNTPPEGACWVEPPQNDAGQYKGSSNPTLEDELRGIKRGALYPYTKTVDVYRCPADDRKRNPDRATFRSYSIAGGMNGEERYDTYTGRAVTRYIEIRNPATKYVFVEEADERTWNMGSWILNPPEEEKWCDPLSFWHDDRSCLGWADGRAEMHRWLDKDTLEGGRDKEAPNNPDLKFMLKGYQLRPE